MICKNLFIVVLEKNVAQILEEDIGQCRINSDVTDIRNMNFWCFMSKHC